MLEELCKGALWDACKDSADKYPLVRLKGYDKPVSPLVHFFGMGYAYNFDFGFVSQVYRSRRGNIKHTAWLWFNENADSICNGYILKRWGCVEKAMLQCGTFEALFNDFQSYFDERRKVFMKTTELAVQARKNELLKNGEKQQAYGGVANLLKVLTKTSLEQGSSIQTVAKIQFAVCMQAGILIPDEFLTDVAVATSIMEDK